VARRLDYEVNTLQKKNTDTIGQKKEKSQRQPAKSLDRNMIETNVAFNYQKNSK